MQRSKADDVINGPEQTDSLRLSARRAFVLCTQRWWRSLPHQLACVRARIFVSAARAGEFVDSSSAACDCNTRSARSGVWGVSLGMNKESKVMSSRCESVRVMCFSFSSAPLVARARVAAIEVGVVVVCDVMSVCR
jgi:hypothetical protein